jgi:HEPN domain-containing protein
MNKKQTAVEWLYETLWKETDFSLPSTILEQAKEMEKQQIIEAYVEGSISLTSKYESKQYYKETYGK